MSYRNLSSPVRGAIVFDLDAPAADVVVTISPSAEMALAELSGPDEIVNGTHPTLDDGRWGLVLPAPAAAGANVIRVGNNITMTIGSVGPGMVVTGDSMTFVNGQLVGGTNVRSVPVPETPRLFVTLPAGSRIDARMGAGKLTVRGYLPGRVTGTKPAAFCRWVFDLLGAAPGDTLDDLFPGSGTVARAWDAYTAETSRLARAERDASASPGERDASVVATTDASAEALSDASRPTSAATLTAVTG